MSHKLNLTQIYTNKIWQDKECQFWEQFYIVSRDFRNAKKVCFNPFFFFFWIFWSYIISAILKTWFPCLASGLSIEEETDRRDDKGRRCCLGTEFIQFHAALQISIRMIWGKRCIEPTLGRMDASEKWKIIWFPPHQATTLPKWIGANWLVRHSILYPEQQRAATTFAFPSVCFFFYGSILCKSGFLFVTLFSLLWDLFPKLENGFPT